MSFDKAQTKELIHELISEVLNEAGQEEMIPYGRKTRAQRVGAFLTKDLFGKKPAKVEKEKRLEAEQRARALYSDIAHTLAKAPQDLEGKIRTLRDIKEKISQTLIWGDDPLLDLIDEAKE